MTKTLDKGMTLDELIKKHRKPSAKRAVALVRQVNRLGTRIGKLAEKKRIALEILAMGPIGPIEVDGEKYLVVKPSGRFVFNVQYELKKLPKNPRPSKAAPEVAPTAEAGV